MDIHNSKFNQPKHNIVPQTHEIVLDHVILPILNLINFMDCEPSYHSTSQHKNPIFNGKEPILTLRNRARIDIHIQNNTDLTQIQKHETALMKIN